MPPTPRRRRSATSRTAAERRMLPSTTRSTRAKPRSKTSAACKRRRPVSDEAIPAATLIVVRERARRPPELLMVERAEGMAFAAGALVFPGGRIDEADRELGERARHRCGGRRRDPRDDRGDGGPGRAVARCPIARSCARASATRWSPTSRSRELLDEHGLGARRGGAHAVRALGAEVPRGAAVRHLVLRRRAARRRLAAARHRRRMRRRRMAHARPRCWSASSAAKRG